MSHMWNQLIAMGLCLIASVPLRAGDGPGTSTAKASKHAPAATSAENGSSLWSDDARDPADTAPSSKPASDTATKESGTSKTASPTSSAAPDAGAGSSAPAKTDAAPRIWIWQGSDDQPVPTKSKPRRRQTFNPLSDTGFDMRLGGNAYVGYSSETQNTAPTYTNFNGGFDLSAAGFLYSPQLASYELSTAYDRSNFGLGPRDAGANGLSYGARCFLLGATPVPFSVSVARSDYDMDGSLATPFNFRNHSAEINGSVLRLPVGLIYRFGAGGSETTNTAGYDWNYRYRNGEVGIRRKWKGFNLNLDDTYLRGKMLINGIADDRTQTTNYLRLNTERYFGPRVALALNGDWSKYQVDEHHRTFSTDADVISFGAGLHWAVTNKLDTAVTALFSRNAVNVLQLIGNSGAPLPNPLPGTTVLDTRSRSFMSNTSYRPTSHWTLGATAAYTAAQLPPALAGAVGPGGPTRFTNSTVSGDGSAAYNRRVWKLEYTGGISAGVQHYANAAGTTGSGEATVYGVTSGISAGDESRLRYGVRFALDRTSNPVFFALLNSNDRMVDLDFASRHFNVMRLTGKVEYRQRAIEYVGSTQRFSGINFLVTVSRSRLDATLGHTISDATERLFGLLSPPGGGPGGGPLDLLMPRVLSSSKSDLAAVTWRARNDLRVNSQFTRFAFTVTGQSTRYLETWFDNSVQYSLGRFDIIGGFVRASGEIGAANRLTNRLYFRIKFPFQIW